ncbi:PREDICTED: T-cell immunoreceptor with Ig and ITIM domains [Condylura cristata]|uniref:T-cell immunoreceptor with Ig and ITIM domains n=1 Tax=Condylura cristata TaxID=143302 RepID=UPI000334515A|nr:PREDICTED: T-cell immunoreceptor with Ig and ITIM domains [Condylura cristata]
MGASTMKCVKNMEEEKEEEEEEEKLTYQNCRLLLLERLFHKTVMKVVEEEEGKYGDFITYVMCSVLPSHQQLASFRDRSGHMHFLLVPFFLLLWAPGLRQASLTDSGAVAQGYISAEEGSSVTLQCHLSSTTANVVQVNWENQEQLLAIYHADWGWHVNPPFMGRVTPGTNLELVLQSLTTNDTGEYFCTYYIYPEGIYKERLFLQVLQNSAAEWSPGLQVLFLVALAAVLGVIGTVVIVVVTLARKKNSLRTHAMERDPRRMASEQENGNPPSLSSPGSCGQAEAAPVSLCREQREDDYDEPHDYFNVLSYRSLGSFSFLAKTG